MRTRQVQQDQVGLDLAERLRSRAPSARARPAGSCSSRCPRPRSAASPARARAPSSGRRRSSSCQRSRCCRGHRDRESGVPSGPIWLRIESGLRLDSMRMTSAPKLARQRLPSGPASTQLKSIDLHAFERAGGIDRRGRNDALGRWAFGRKPVEDLARSAFGRKPVEDLARWAFGRKPVEDLARWAFGRKRRRGSRANGRSAESPSRISPVCSPRIGAREIATPSPMPSTGDRRNPSEVAERVVVDVEELVIREELLVTRDVLEVEHGQTDDVRFERTRRRTHRGATRP